MDLNNFLHVACNYHYLGLVLTWKYLKQGFWENPSMFTKLSHKQESVTADRRTVAISISPIAIAGR
jgi:hypothetical protein